MKTFSNFRHWFSRRSVRSIESAARDSQPVPSCLLSGVRLVFGLDWSPVSDPLNIEPDLQNARKAGYNHMALMPDSSLLGLARSLAPARGKCYSAVVVLVDQLSTSEAAIFVLGMGNQQFAVVGLMNRRPVPGFDMLFSELAEAKRTLDDFRAMHVGQHIHVFSNLLDDIDYNEPVVLDHLVSSVDKSAQITRLINRPLRRIVGALTLGVILLSGGVAALLWHQAQEREAREQAERAALAADPNYQYEKSIETLLIGAGQPGNQMLQDWKTIINQLPLVIDGWRLTGVECRAIGCKASWVRSHGNFSDFDAQLPANALGPPELSEKTGNASNLLDNQLVTQHPVPVSKEKGRALQRAQLPLLRDATARWGSTLQDVSLARESSAQAAASQGTTFAAPILLGAGTVEQLKRPVVKMDWKWSDRIWSLPALSLPAYVVPEALSVVVAASEIDYILTGTLYAKGKDF